MSNRRDSIRWLHNRRERNDSIEFHWPSNGLDGWPCLTREYKIRQAVEHRQPNPTRVDPNPGLERLLSLVSHSDDSEVPFLWGRLVFPQHMNDLGIQDAGQTRSQCESPLARTITLRTRSVSKDSALKRRVELDVARLTNRD